MAVIGTATLNVVPKISGLSDAVRSEFAKVPAETLGEQTGSKYTKGVNTSLVKSGVIVGTFAAITNKAISSISSHIGSATSRFDTLNNYPKVMESMGYSTEVAEASIAKMSDRLQTLPTTLDSMVRQTQGIVTITRDLDKATSASLAINDMLLASGSNQQLVNSAQEQFRQILAKGKPEMQDWKSLTMAMPGQLDQLARSLLGPTANANDLYAALGGGKNEQIISMDRLLDEIIRLDEEGGQGFASFKDQAETAAMGVETSVANMGNSITRGITSTMDTIGKENIVAFFNDMKGGINATFGTINSVLSGAMPLIKGAYDLIKPFAPALIAGGIGYTVFAGGVNKASGIIGGFSERISVAENAATKSGKSFGKLSKITAGLGGGFNLAAIGIGVGVTAIALIAGAIEDARKKEENFNKATVGLSEAVSNTAALDEYAGKVNNIGANASFSALSIDELAESSAKHVDKMNETTQKAQEQLGVLNSAQNIITSYAGQTDLTSEAQGKLQWALQQVNDQFGLSITAADVASGKYTDQNGNVQDLSSSINNLIETKKREIQLDALSSNLSEAYANKAEASRTYAAAIQEKAKSVEVMNRNLAAGNLTQGEYNDRMNELDKNITDSRNIYNEAANGVSRLEEEMGDAAKSASDAADAYDEWGNKVNEVFTSLLEASGSSLGSLKDDLRSLGVETETLNRLNDSQLEDLALAYDGTAGSIISCLDTMGVRMDETARKSAQMVDEMRDALEGMDIEEPLENAGVAIGDLAQRMVDAGISTENLNAVGSENLAALAESCGGNISLMIAHLQNYNATPLYDKSGMVNADDTTLVDALGNIYTWNGEGLIDKNGQAVVNRVELEDAQGSLVTWNGTELQDKDGNAIVKGNMAQSITTRNSWNNGDLFDKECTATINVVRNISTNTMNAAGGYRLNAAGGYRYHADGFIATRATFLPPRDIVGEAGAEAIVPLTNKTYAQPFIDMLVEGINKSQSRSREDWQSLAKIYSVLCAIYEAIPELNERDADRFIRRLLHE